MFLIFIPGWTQIIERTVSLVFVVEQATYLDLEKLLYAIVIILAPRKRLGPPKAAMVIWSTLKNS